MKSENRKTFIPAVSLLRVSCVGLSMLVFPVNAKTVAYWRFEDDVGSQKLVSEGQDSSMELIRGTFESSTWKDCGFEPKGYAGQALFFDGQGAVGEIAGLSSDKEKSSRLWVDSFTVECFIYPYSLPSSGRYSALVNLSDVSSGVTKYAVGLIGTDSGACLQCDFSGSAAADRDFGSFKSMPLASGEWTYVAVSFDSKEKSLTLRVNEETQTFQTDTVPLARSRVHAPVFSLAGRYGTTKASWDESVKYDGLMDELRISDAVLLPDELLLHDLSASMNDSEVPVTLQHRLTSRYDALAVTEDALHPIAEGVGEVVVAPWTHSSAKDLLVIDRPRYGSSRGIMSPIGTAENGVPVFSPKQTVSLPFGTALRVWSRRDGLFDLLAEGKNTPYGKKEIVFIKNTGTEGKPAFGDISPVFFGGKSLKESFTSPKTYKSFSNGDLDGDGTDDLLLIASCNRPGDEYWPDGVSMWKGEYFNSGPGRGYDVDGNWLGDRHRLELFWAKGEGVASEGVPSFGAVRSVSYGRLGTPVQWESYNEVVSEVLTIGSNRYILLAGDVNRLLALPVSISGDDVVCDRSIPLLKNGADMENAYAYKFICVSDVDSDGFEDVLVSGTPGRIALMQGTVVGEFEEVGPLLCRGGHVSVDTLAVPCRTAFDHDDFSDLIIGDASGRLSFWPGTEDPLVYGAPVFFRTGGERLRHVAGQTGSIQGPQEACWGYTCPTVGDWGNDGVTDIIINDINGYLTSYHSGETLFDLTGEVFEYNGKPLPVASRVRPSIVDTGDSQKLLVMDFDGDLALLTPAVPGSVQIAAMEKLLNRRGDAICLCGPNGLWGRTKPTVSDWDGDGVWDIVFGTHKQLFQFFLSAEEQKKVAGASPTWMRNVGTAASPVFDEPKLILRNDGASFDFRVHTASVWPTDLNNDELPDAIVGADDGKVYPFYGVRVPGDPVPRLKAAH